MRRTEVKKVLCKSVFFRPGGGCGGEGATAPQDGQGLEGVRIGRTIRFMTSDAAREIDRLRQEVAVLQRRVRELGESSDKFLAVATHDLRAPLASLRLIADMLAQPGRVNPDSRNLIEIMDRNVDAMEALVSNVLNASRLSHPGTSLNLEKFEINGLIEDTLAGYFQLAIRRKVALDANLSPEAGTVLADRARLGQAITNLVGNALKFTPSGGTVLVASDGGEDWAEVSVSDTGPGLTAVDKDKLFTSFYRGSAEPAHGDPSTGLGLYIVRRIAEAHGGTVGAEGEPGKGSLFFFRISRRATQSIGTPGSQEQ